MGPAREDSSRPNIITMGGSGFGIASFTVAVEEDGFQELKLFVNGKVLSFLELSEKYHGAFLIGMINSGNTAQFGELDDGGDIVETALLMQGLLLQAILRKFIRRNTNKR